MKKILFIAAIFLISCQKEETPQPNNQKVTQSTTPLPINTIDITGTWYDYNHISGSGFNVPVKFIFYLNKYSYSEFTASSWNQLIGSSQVYRNDLDLSMPYNSTNYKFYGTILNDSTIEITQYSSLDTLPSYQIHKSN